MTFPDSPPPLSPVQAELLRQFQLEAVGLNRKHNLVSRASDKEFWDRHIRHSLCLGFRRFPAGCTVVDWGSGGGLPGIPLAIAFPETRFVLVDSIEKKVRAIRTVARRLGLSNVIAWCGRAETWDGQANFAVSRATAPLVDLWTWTSRVLEVCPSQQGEWESGLLALKGGDLGEEVSSLTSADPTVSVASHDIAHLLPGDSSSEKQIIHVRRAPLT